MKLSQLLLLFSFSFAAVINIPADYPTIQQGIDAAIEDDTVLVAQGIYYENLIVEKTITIASHAIYDDLSDWVIYAEEYETYEITNENILGTIIDGSGGAPDQVFQSCILINSPEGDCIEPLVIGFTLKGGQGTQTEEIIETPEGNETVILFQGGGIMINNALPEIHYSVLIENGGDALFSGGGMNTSTGVDFPENEQGIQGYFPRCEGDTVDFSHNYFYGNEGLFGNLLGTTDFEGFIDLSYSIVEVFNEASEEMNETWVSTDDDVETEFTGTEGEMEYIYSDVWIAVNGSDETGNGSEQNPLQTITRALEVIFPTVGNNITIHLGPGTYSPSLTGEIFPIGVISNITISGSGEDVTILNAEGTVSEANEGSIFVIQNTINVIIENLTISNAYMSTYHGGGVYIRKASPTFRDVIIDNNEVSGFYGGGVYMLESQSIFRRVIFSNNEAKSGGAIVSYYSDFYLSNSILENNIAESGAGISLNKSNPDISSNQFIGNVASMSGGAIAIQNSEPLIDHNFIHGNQAREGGAIVLAYLVDGYYPIISNNEISNNMSTSGDPQIPGRGGAIYATYATPILINNTVVNNIAEGIPDCNPMVESCPEGGGMWYMQSHPVIINSIFWGNIPNQLHTYAFFTIYPSEIDIDYSNIEGGEQGIDQGIFTPSIINWGENNLETEPNFIDENANNYSLNGDSPCIDSGINNYQYNDTIIFNFEENQYLGATIDIGAYEYGANYGCTDSEALNFDNDANVDDGSCEYPILSNYNYSEQFTLGSPYPNPFNPITNIPVTIDKPGHVNLKVYDINGRERKTLINTFLNSGTYTYSWNGSYESSGIYFIVLEKDGKVFSQKIILIK